MMTARERAAALRKEYGACRPGTPGCVTCGTCGRAWLHDIAPAARCPWEYTKEHRPPKGDRMTARGSRLPPKPEPPKPREAINMSTDTGARTAATLYELHSDTGHTVLVEAPSWRRHQRIPTVIASWAREVWIPSLPGATSATVAEVIPLKFYAAAPHTMNRTAQSIEIGSIEK